MAETQFKPGDKVLWSTGGWWGKVPAEVLRLSKTGKRVKIKTAPLKQLYDRPYYAMVTPAKLELVND